MYSSNCRKRVFLKAILWFAALAGPLVASAIWPTPAPATECAGFVRSDYVLPPQAVKDGVSFAGAKIPLERRDVRARVQEQINYLLMDRRSRLLEWFDSMAEYGPTMRKVLADEQVPEDLIYLAALTGDLKANTKTRAGGVGWWGLSAPKGRKGAAPWTATDDWDDRRDPVLSTRIAASLLKASQPKKNGPDWVLAVATFVDGTDNITETLNKSPGFSFWDVVAPTSSEALIPRLIALKIIDGNRAFYHVDAPPRPPAAHDFLGRVALTKELPLYVLAKWLGITPRAAWELNPGVSPASGVFPKADKKYASGFPMRVPKGAEPKVRELLVKEGYAPKQ